MVHHGRWGIRTGPCLWSQWWTSSSCCDQLPTGAGIVPRNTDSQAARGRLHRPRPPSGAYLGHWGGRSRLIGIAKTGSGKTLAFLMPGFLRITQTRSRMPQLCVLAPTVSWRVKLKRKPRNSAEPRAFEPSAAMEGHPGVNSWGFEAWSPGDCSLPWTPQWLFAEWLCEFGQRVLPGLGWSRPDAGHGIWTPDPTSQVPQLVNTPLFTSFHYSYNNTDGVLLAASNIARMSWDFYVWWYFMCVGCPVMAKMSASHRGHQGSSWTATNFALHCLLVTVGLRFGWLMVPWLFFILEYTSCSRDHYNLGGALDYLLLFTFSTCLAEV